MDFTTAVGSLKRRALEADAEQQKNVKRQNIATENPENILTSTSSAPEAAASSSSSAVVNVVAPVPQKVSAPPGSVRIATKTGRGVAGPKFPNVPGFTTIDCTSGSMNKVKGLWAKDALSPMLIGPVQYPGDPEAKIFENFWQYSKVFRELGHVTIVKKPAPIGNGQGSGGDPSNKDSAGVQKQVVNETWKKWRLQGFASKVGQRHPKGTKTDRVKFIGDDGKRRFEYLRADFSFFGGETMDYITSRKKIYAPTYARLVRGSAVFREMRKNVMSGKEKIQIVDFDGPADGDLGDGRNSHIVTVELLREKINDPKKPFGHGYVLAGLLAGIEPEEYCQ